MHKEDIQRAIDIISPSIMQHFNVLLSSDVELNCLVDAIFYAGSTPVVNHESNLIDLIIYELWRTKIMAQFEVRLLSSSGEISGIFESKTRWERQINFLQQKLYLYRKNNRKNPDGSIKNDPFYFSGKNYKAGYPTSDEEDLTYTQYRSKVDKYVESGFNINDLNNHDIACYYIGFGNYNGIDPENLIP